MESVFNSPAHRDFFRAQYGNILSQFPVTQRYVETTFGQTFLLSRGDAANPPVILLHGSCSNSAFWLPEILALSANHCVYAVDIIGEAGNSHEIRPDLHTDAFARWMSEVLDALGIAKAALLGNSLGGWMALKTATEYPERVSALTLIASAGLAPIRPAFLHNVAQNRDWDTVAPSDAALPGLSGIPPEVLAFMQLILESYQPIPALPVFTDDALSRLAMPLLFIDGEEDEIIDAPKSAARLKRLHPRAEIHLLPQTGHMVTNVAALVAPFLASADAS